MKPWIFISTALISCSSSILLSFVSRLIEDLSFPIIVVRLLAIGIMFWLLYDQQENKAVFGVIGCGLLAGWLLGHWDEIRLLFQYQLLEVMLLPLTALMLIIVVVALNYGIRKAKSF